MAMYGHHDDSYVSGKNGALQWIGTYTKTILNKSSEQDCGNVNDHGNKDSDDDLTQEKKLLFPTWQVGL